MVTILWLPAVIRGISLKTTQKLCYQGIFFYEVFMMWVVHDTSVSNLTHQKRTIHRCFPASVHNIYSKVAMVTILGARLALFAVIRVHLKSIHIFPFTRWFYRTDDSI